LQRKLYQDPEFNFFAETECVGAGGMELASWLSYNPSNRTVHGVAEDLGVYLVDCIHSDDAGAKTYSNFKIEVIPVEDEVVTFVRLYYLTFWALVPFLIYLSYAWLFSIQLFTVRVMMKNQDKKMAQEAVQRFRDFDDVQMEFVFPDFILPEVPSADAVVTHDTDFLGVDQLRKIREKKKRKEERRRARRHS